jgi:hypothetical protein
VKPDIPGAPSGVQSAAPSVVTGESGLSLFSEKTGIPTAWMAQGTDGCYALNAAAAKQRAETLWDGVRETRSLPVFTAPIENSGDVAAVGFAVKGSFLLADFPSEMKLMKVRSGSRPPLEFRYAESGCGDGTFRLLNGGTAYTGAISESAEYTLVLFIKDGGDYDLDGIADGSVTDPAVIVSAEDNEGGINGLDGSGGGGGCDAGGLASFALLLAGLAVAKRITKKNTGMESGSER